MKAPSLTIGIEEEYQIIDPATGELKSYITQILEDGKLILREQIKAELHQSMVEVGTEICQTPAEARAELVKLRRCITELAGRHGLVIAAAGTHPFSYWEHAGDHAVRALPRRQAGHGATWPSNCSSSARTSTSASRTATS